MQFIRKYVINDDDAYLGNGWKLRAFMWKTFSQNDIY